MAHKLLLKLVLMNDDTLHKSFRTSDDVVESSILKAEISSLSADVALLSAADNATDILLMPLNM